MATETETNKESMVGMVGVAVHIPCRCELIGRGDLKDPVTIKHCEQHAGTAKYRMTIPSSTGGEPHIAYAEDYETMSLIVVAFEMCHVRDVKIDVMTRGKWEHDFTARL